MIYLSTISSGTTAGSIASYADERLQSIIFRLVWVRDPLPAPIQTRLRSVADSLERSLEGLREAENFKTDETLALLHGDIGPGNILWGPDPVLIDWEYARPGNPADEIAYCSTRTVSPHASGTRSGAGIERASAVSRG